MHRWYQMRTSCFVVMSDPFVPLAAYLRPPAPEPALASSAPTAPEPEIAPVSFEYDETLRAARRFRAALADVLDAAVQQLLPTIAREVLARELRLEGADVAAIVTAALDRFDEERVLSVRAHPHDCEALARIELERIADDALLPGDIFLELRSGTIDLRLRTRLDGVLAAWTR